MTHEPGGSATVDSSSLTSRGLLTFNPDHKSFWVRLYIHLDGDR
jgi:hypothetical protein